VSGVKADAYGLTRQREWVIQNLVHPGEWFVFADDNIRSLTAVGDVFYDMPEIPAENFPRQMLKALYATPCDASRFERIAQDTIVYAQTVGAQLCGFAVVDNYFFRGKKFRQVGYVIGKLMLMQQNTIPFDHTITMEDFRNTAEHLLVNGAVVVNNYLFPVAGHYEAGGMGKYAERVPYRQRDVLALLAQYPGLFRVHNRDGFEPNTDLALRLHSPEQIQRWRREMQRRRERETTR
jgi:hypothetical protein